MQAANRIFIRMRPFFATAAAACLVLCTYQKAAGNSCRLRLQIKRDLRRIPNAGSLKCKIVAVRKSIGAGNSIAVDQINIEHPKIGLVA